MESIKVFAPATVANVSCGFDVLGFAVEQPGDELVLRKANHNRIEIVEITGDNGKLPRNPTENTATVAIQKFLEKLEISQGLEVSLYKKMPLGSGMGSSAASAVAGVFAVNKLLGEPLSVAELLPFAMEGERIACGAAHADNVAPSLYGGLVLIRSYEPLDVVRVPMPKDLFCVLMHPHIHIRTEDARAILKRQVPMQKAIQQSGNLAGLILGFTQSDYGLISRSMQDVIVEPVRSILIPGFHAIKKVALENGALGFSISGSGPSMFALCKGKEIADRVGEVMKSSLESLEIDSEIFISEVNLDGPKVI
jgi:homoserine kinase